MIAPAVERRDLLAYYLHFCKKTIDAEYKILDNQDAVWIDGGPCTLYGCEVKDAHSPFDVEFQFYLKGNPHQKHTGYIDNFIFKESDLEMIVRERDEHVSKLQRFPD